MTRKTTVGIGRPRDRVWAADVALSVERWGKTLYRRRCPSSGFTLLEILVALGVLGIILSAVYGSYRAVNTSVVGLQPRIALDHTGRFFVQRLARQIRCCYGGSLHASRSSTRQRNSDDLESAKERVALFRGGQAMAGDILLQLVTSGCASTWRLESECLMVVSYKLDTWRHSLLTWEYVYGQRDQGDQENWQVILEGVIEIEFEYFDGTDWQVEWDSEVLGGPPRAVRVRAVLQLPEVGNTASFTTVVPILCGGPARPKNIQKRSSATDSGEDS
jgi:prepilin-type N-terminal cleavage/methylation domain-containing protein